MPRAAVSNMRIERIDAALERCVKYLSTADVSDKEIENLLTHSLLILICAEFEKKFRELLRERCSSVNDRSINEYIESHVRRSPRGLKSSDIADILAQFGPMHREEFKRRREENRQAESMYSSIVTNRNNRGPRQRQQRDPGGGQAVLRRRTRVAGLLQGRAVVRRRCRVTW